MSSTLKARDVRIPEEMQRQWQRSIELIVAVAEIPVGLIMRVMDEDIEVFLASQSKANPYRPGQRERLADSGLYCEEVIKSKHPLLVADALADPKWRDNPDVKLNMVSYLGFPILLPDWTPFGTICVLDCKANPYTDKVYHLLETFRDMIQSQLQLLYVSAEQAERNRNLSNYLDELQVLRAMVSRCVSCKRLKDADGRWHSIAEYLNTHAGTSDAKEHCPDCAQAEGRSSAA